MWNYPTKKWKEAFLDEVDIDYRVFDNMLKTIREDFTHVNSVLVIKNDSIVFEKYFNGFRKTSRQKVGCIFKSFISAVVGIALEEHRIESLSTRIVDIFTDNRGTQKSREFDKITLEHALTKTTGLKWRDPEYYNNCSLNDVERFFELEVENEPGEVFEYKPDPQIAVCAIEYLVGESFVEYCDKRLFKPLNITNYLWDTNMDSIEKLEMTARDLAKLGYLFLRKGKWEDKQLFSEKYWVSATSEKIYAMSHENTGYGYLWWIQELAGLQTFYASGFGGQYLCVIPEFDMVVVITSQMNCPHNENKFLIRNLISDINIYKGENMARKKDDKRFYNRIKFSSEEKKRMLEEIRLFFEEERDETIGFLATEQLYNFFIDELGEIIYNKALDDAKVWFAHNMENLDSDYYLLYK